MTNAVLKEPVLDQKRVTITSKRQFTIPQKYFTQVAECLLTRDAIIIRPIAANQGGELAESILADLIAQGLSGQELLEAFREKQAQVGPAVKAMLSDARKVAKGQKEYETMDDVFSAED